MLRPILVRAVSGSLVLLALGCGDSAGSNPEGPPSFINQNDAGGTGGSGSTGGTTGGGATSGSTGAGGTTGSAGWDAGSSGSSFDAAGQSSGFDAAGLTGQDAAGSDAGAGGGEVVCPATPLRPGDYDRTISVGGRTRRYTLHVPQSYSGTTPVPLLTDWHPILGDGAAERKVSGFEAISDREGFLVAWADGIDGAWNVGSCCTLSREVDDVAFARQMIAEIESEACVDKKRVYAAGFSMGGGMSYKLACDASDIIAAVAPSSFQLFTEDEWPCQPARPLTVIMFNGALDFVVPYAGGASRPPNGLNVTNHFLGTEETFAKWAEFNGCTGTPRTEGECRTYDSCSAGVEVTLCLKAFGSHSPGDANVAWSTLERFTLP